METSTQGGTPAAPEMGPLARLIGVFTSPGKTFESIAAKPGWDWLVPVAVLMLAFGCARFVMTKKVDVDEAVKQRVELVESLAKRELPEENRKEVEAATRKELVRAANPVFVAATSLMVFIPIFLVPALYHGIAAAFGLKRRYMPVVSGYSWSQLPQAIAGFLTTLVAWPQSRLDVNDVQYMRVLKSNVGAMLSFQDTNKALLGLLSSVDVFDIWSFFLVSIMLTKTTQFGLKGAMGTAGAVWLVYILIKVALGGMMSMFGM